MLGALVCLFRNRKKKLSNKRKLTFSYICISITHKMSFVFFLYIVSLRIACLLIAHEFWKYAVIADFSAPALPLGDKPEEESLDLKPINNTDNFRSITKDTSGKPWDDQISIRCLRPSGKCEKLLNSTCFDGKLPYRFTSSQLASEQSQDKSLSKLYQLEGLRYIPKCWAVIQVRNRKTKFHFQLEIFNNKIPFLLCAAIFVCCLFAKMYASEWTRICLFAIA